MFIGTRKDTSTLAVMRRDTRDALLDATLEAVAHVGLTKLSLGDVAARAGALWWDRNRRINSNGR
jgi:AcrR family transcriptional regulator